MIVVLQRSDSISSSYFTLSCKELSRNSAVFLKHNLNDRNSSLQNYSERTPLANDVLRRSISHLIAKSEKIPIVFHCGYIFFIVFIFVSTVLRFD